MGNQKPTKQVLPKPLVLRPSSAYSWTRCSAGPALARWIPDEETVAPWLLEGTFAHYLAELCLTKGKAPRGYLGKKIPCVVDEDTEFERTETFVPGAEMVSAVASYIEVTEHYTDEVRKADGKFGHFVEKRLDTTFGGVRKFPIGGTADHVLVSPKRIIVTDLKFGENVEVEAVDNRQLATYLFAAYDLWGSQLTEEIVGVIVQPRLVTGGEYVKEWRIKNPQKWYAENHKIWDLAIKKIMDQGNDLSFNVSPEACKWCDSMRYCRGLWSIVEMIIHNLETEAPELPPEMVREVLLRIKPVRDFLYELERHSVTRALSGEKFKGFKLVEGGRPPNRVYRDEGKVVELLDEKIENDEVEEELVFTDRKPISPAQLEKVLGKKFVADLVTRGYGNRPTILVPDSDKRKPIATAADDFADLLEGFDDDEEDDGFDLDDFGTDDDEDFDI